MRTLVVALGCALVVVASPVQCADAFAPGCTLPFDDIAEHHTIDAICDNDGSATQAGQVAQNEQKNNFCAAGTPALITRHSFLGLQAKSDELGITGTPEDRSGLHDVYTTSEGATIGEGSLIHFAGYIIDAHYSNVSKGESCNCKQKGRSRNDVHVIMHNFASTGDYCRTVTVEVSPHGRPADWETGVLNDLAGRPVRITGQLYFDGIHKPCTPGHPTSPPRASVWEIHPVYGIDVCKHAHLSDCSADDESAWTRLSDYLLSDEIEHENAEPDE